MSKFFSYEELQNSVPLKEAVALARDELIEFIFKERYVGKDISSNVFIYGSSIWELHKNFPAQHTKRSDVDICIFEERREYFRGIDALEEICQKVTSETGVPIDFNVFGESDSIEFTNYSTPWVSPSVNDHFELLHKEAKNFSGKLAHRFQWFPFHAIKQINRFEDLENYLGSVYRENLMPLVDASEVDLIGQNNLEMLSIVENFPEHFVRKVLGIYDKLPCPDSKSNCMNVFYSLPSSKFQRTIAPLCNNLTQFSHQYERLIDKANSDYTERRYYKELSKIARGIVAITIQMFEHIPLTNPSDIKQYITH